MPGKSYILISVITAALFLYLACEENPFQPGETDFYVTVFDYSGPLEGVVIQGGIDWDYFYVVTDSQGQALIPGRAYGRRATFRKNNYFSDAIDELKPGEYTLLPTPFILTEIGEVAGEAIKFGSDQIVTINHGGEYRVYSYNEYGVTEETMIEFPYEPRWFRFQRDTLWFSGYDGDIYAYYMIDVFNPHLRLHLELDSPSSIFDWKDSLLAVGTPHSSLNSALGIYSFYPDSSYNELYRLEDFWVDQIFFVSDYLVTLGFYNNLLSVFDVSNPSDIRLAVVNYHYNPVGSFMWGDTLGINYGYGGSSSRCRLFEFSDALNPEMIANFPVEGEIKEIYNDSIAVGYHYGYYYGSPCVFNGSIYEGLQAVAIFSEGTYPPFGGGGPPYFIMGGKLWKLEERQ
jgi:hypothetical protein